MRPSPNMATSMMAGDISLREKRRADIQGGGKGLQVNRMPSYGACAFLGTASTMQAMAEALGLALPGGALALQL